MANQELADHINAADCDIYIYSGDITPGGADTLISKIVERNPRRANCALVLTTYGGNPDGAYRIARTLKRIYGGFTAYIFGSCKSAGTLIAIGAAEIVMTDFGELGPLDIQMPRVDELDSESGLVYSQALNALKEHAFNFFEDTYLRIKNNSGGAISTKTASAIATELSTGLISPLAAQIDPLKVGAATRALEITYAYGERLTDNMNALNKLINGYPSHGFVIDYEEARDLLGNVRPLAPDEEASFGQLRKSLRHPNEKVFVAILDEILDDAPAQNQKGETDDKPSQRPGEAGDAEAVEEDNGDRPEEHPENNVYPAPVVVTEGLLTETDQSEGFGEVGIAGP
jgi:hypothetical protein